MNSASKTKQKVFNGLL